jgi:hypothetical protein
LQPILHFFPQGLTVPIFLYLPIYRSFPLADLHFTDQTRSSTMSHFAGSNPEGNHPEGQAPEDNLQEEDYENLEEIEKVLLAKTRYFRNIIDNNNFNLGIGQANEFGRW